MNYAELHCHSYYSFHDGASSLEELMVRSKDLGYHSLAITDHDNLCGAMCVAQLAKSLELHAIIGAEVTTGYNNPSLSPHSRLLSPARERIKVRGNDETIQDDKEEEDILHLTLLAKDRTGYANLCRLITAAHAAGERNDPRLDTALLPQYAQGLIVLSGCPQGELSRLVVANRFDEAVRLVRQYLDWFGTENYYIELQHNLAPGDTERNRHLIAVARETGARLVATGNVHYHDRSRHRLQDCLVAIKHCTSLEESHRQRRANSEYYLRPVAELAGLFKDCPEALANTIDIAERCTFDLTSDQLYSFPDYPAPEGFTAQSYLETLCYESAIRRYGSVTAPVRRRLDEEFRLIRKFNLAGFLLMYHEVIKLGREVMIEQGLSDPSLPVEENPPGRGRGSSVALLAGYLIGLSHIDPLQYNLSLERFLPDDVMSGPPDIDLDFPRSIREALIIRTHEKWGWRNAALASTIATYQIKGAVRDLGKALGLPDADIDQLAKQSDWGSARKLRAKMERMPNFKDKIDTPVWRDLIELAAELDGVPRYMGQHPGGMILSSTQLTDIVPIQRGAIDGRYVCQWDKDSIDDAGFVKIDFLALGALSQMQEAVELVRARTGKRIDLSRIDFEDNNVYDMLCTGDTIGIFQVESAAQMQTITRLHPRNLLDMAHEVAAVRPGVGVNNGVYEYLARRNKHKPVTYDHPLEQRALERTLGIILFQDQVNQLAIDVAGFAPSEADRLRRAFGRKHNTELLERYRQQFIAGAAERGADEETALKIFDKFNGQYMFPESHAFAFGVTAYQASWLKYYYPLEFFVAIFNQQPMGFYNLETLKEDAKRHGVRVLNPDINLSGEKCVIAEEVPLSLRVPDKVGTKQSVPVSQTTRHPVTSSCHPECSEGSVTSTASRIKTDASVVALPQHDSLEKSQGTVDSLSSLLSPPWERACPVLDTGIKSLPRTGYGVRGKTSDRYSPAHLKDTINPTTTMMDSRLPDLPCGTGRGNDNEKTATSKRTDASVVALPQHDSLEKSQGTVDSLSSLLSPPRERIKVRENKFTLHDNRANGALRLGFLQVEGLGPASAEAILKARENGLFTGIGDFLERTGILEETALNLAAAGAFDSIQPNRRTARWEIGLRYRPLNIQLPLDLPVEQDIVPLEAPGAWEKMKDEYSVLSLHPGGHIMEHLRPRFKRGYVTSKDITGIPDGARVTAVGLVIRRQRPRGKVVFITLEDEFGHIPCMVFGKTYQDNEPAFRSPFLAVKGELTRREGTCNLVIRQVKGFTALDRIPRSKDWH